jgi:altronate dehydratase small subunit
MAVANRMTCHAVDFQPKNGMAKGIMGDQLWAQPRNSVRRTAMPIDAIVGHEKDNVATALADIAAGAQAWTRVGPAMKKMMVCEPIPYGHKFAVASMEKGEHVIKYGEVIGSTTGKIGAGCHVHVHNVESLRGRGDCK